MCEEEIIKELKRIYRQLKFYDSRGRNSIFEILDLYKKEQEEIENLEENYRALLEDNAQAFKDLGLPEDTIVADELVLEINKRYISKDKIKKEIEELKNMKVKGEVFITSRNFAIKILENLLEEK